jgi:hypothetical protein
MVIKYNDTKKGIKKKSNSTNSQYSTVIKYNNTKIGIKLKSNSTNSQYFPQKNIILLR